MPQQVKQHPFFHGVDWAMVIRKQYRPPFLPCRRRRTDSTDTQGIKNFARDQREAGFQFYYRDL